MSVFFSFHPVYNFNRDRPDCCKAKIPVLEKEKQQKFQEKLTGINGEIKNHQDKIAELKQKKETLLNRVISQE